MIDKIPVKDFRQDVTDGLWVLGSIRLTSAEYGFAETINQLIDYVRELKDENEQVRKDIATLQKRIRKI